MSAFAHIDREIAAYIEAIDKMIGSSDLSQADLEALWLVDREAFERAKGLQQGLTEEPAKLDDLNACFERFHRDGVLPLALAHRHRIKAMADALEQLLARVEKLEAQPARSVHYAGVFKDGERYAEGSLSTRAGSLWLATKTTTSTPGFPGSDWTLVVKRGTAT